MHTYNISSQDAANDSTSGGARDGQALPIYVKGQEVIAGTRAARRTERQAARKNRDAAVDGQIGGAGENGTAAASPDFDR